MTKQTNTFPAEAGSATGSLGRLILTLRGERVMLAGDLATIYGVETRALNQAVKRNADRFPADFAFQLTSDELAELRSSGLARSDGRVALRSQIVTLKRGQHIKYPPMVFTEHGAIMAANVLNSQRAVAMSVYVVRAFVKQREAIAANQAILKRLSEIDATLLRHDTALREIYRNLRPLLEPPPQPPRRQIGFHVKPEICPRGSRSHVTSEEPCLAPSLRHQDLKARKPPNDSKPAGSPKRCGGSRARA